MKIFNSDIKILGDDEGFIRFECPYCKSEFKISEKDLQDMGYIYFELFCPYCGLSKEIKYFYTREIKSKTTKAKREKNKKVEKEDTNKKSSNNNIRLSSSKSLDLSFSSSFLLILFLSTIFSILLLIINIHLNYFALKY